MSKRLPSTGYQFPSLSGRDEVAARYGVSVKPWRRSLPIVSPGNRLLLIVDEEDAMVRFAQANLEIEGFRVLDASTGLEALKKVREELPSLVLLNLTLPDLDGFETMARMKEVSSVPVILLAGEASEDDMVRGLDRGAEDWVVKPFSPRELASRIRAVLRRVDSPVPADDGAIYVDDSLAVDVDQREAIVEGRRISLRPLEYRLLYHLVNNPGTVMTHDALLSKVWGHEYRDDKQLLRLYITYLRQKIEPVPGQPRYVLTERGAGYRFIDFVNN